jgi:hypothetical protein
VTNVDTIRFHNRWYQLHKSALPGLRSGPVIVEERRDGTMTIRFQERCLPYHEIDATGKPRDELAVAFVVSPESRPPLAAGFAEEMTGSRTGHFYTGAKRGHFYLGVTK